MRKLIIISSILIPVILTIYIFSTQFVVSPGEDKLKNIAMPIQIERLEDRLFSSQTKEEIAALLQDYPLLAKQFWGVENEQDTHKIVDRLHEMIHHPAMRQLYQEVQHTFKNLDALTQELTYAFKYLKYFDSSLEAPQVMTVVTGMGTDLYVSKELIVIGLDFFLGDDATWRPQGMPDYILRTYQPAYIAPKIILALSRYFNTKDQQDHTLLHDMLHCGKAYYFTKILLPNLPESVILGYTPAQWEDTNKHQSIVWKHFIDHELFYQTDPMIKSKYLGARPFTSEIGPGCPGNIGGWLGFEIIKKFMKQKSHLTLPMLMEKTDMPQVFKEAKYKPQ